MDERQHLNRQLIDFYEGKGVDCRGQHLETLLAWPNEKLEYQHDFIQWLFPLDEGSRYAVSAPIVDSTTIAHFKASQTIQLNLRRAFARMLRFYGFFCQENAFIRVPLVEQVQALQAAPDWFDRDDHNVQRITRIMKSMRLFGLANFAQALRAALTELTIKFPDRVSNEELRHWQISLNVAVA